jgi:hypothetical protein
MDRIIKYSVGETSNGINVHTKYYANQSLGLKAAGRHRQHRHILSYFEKGT